MTDANSVAELSSSIETLLKLAADHEQAARDIRDTLAQLRKVLNAEIPRSVGRRRRRIRQRDVDAPLDLDRMQGVA